MCYAMLNSRYIHELTLIYVSSHKKSLCYRCVLVQLTLWSDDFSMIRLSTWKLNRITQPRNWDFLFVRFGVILSFNVSVAKQINLMCIAQVVSLWLLLLLLVRTHKKFIRNYLELLATLKRSGTIHTNIIYIHRAHTVCGNSIQSQFHRH